MKKALTILFLCIVAAPVFAYDVVFVHPKEQYEIIKIEGDPYIEHNFLGTLNEYPEMYELRTDVTIRFTATVFQKSTGTTLPFGLMFVRQNDTDDGVTEIERSHTPLQDWKEMYVPPLGLVFRKGSSIIKEITPGTYHLEVSTPDNKGDYMLIIGEEPAPRSYFKTLVDVARIQYHFGYTPFHFPLSSYVYYPTAILGVLLILGFRYRARYLKKNKQYVRFTP